MVDWKEKEKLEHSFEEAIKGIQQKEPPRDLPRASTVTSIKTNLTNLIQILKINLPNLPNLQCYWIYRIYQIYPQQHIMGFLTSQRNNYYPFQL